MHVRLDGAATQKILRRYNVMVLSSVTFATTDSRFISFLSRKSVAGTSRNSGRKNTG